MYTTGSSQRIDDFRRPLLSAGVAGVTTTRPGVCTYQASGDWECCAAIPPRIPMGIRATSGTRACPPNMYRALAAWLTSSETEHMAKSENRISAIGRVPASAAPTAAPMIVDSEIGVSTIRSGPNSACRSLYWPAIPPS